MNKQPKIFPWNENFATGILQIDEQHQRLVQLLNQLAGCVAYQPELPVFSAIFNELAEYALYHFHTEEEFWHHYFAGDSWEEEHKAAHNGFASDALRLKSAENSKPPAEVLEDVLSFLSHWLAFHILETDKRMARVALAVQSGMPLEEAKGQAEQEMSGAIRVLIETLLSMYDALSHRTLELMSELMDRQNAEAKLLLAANAIENTLDAICITDADGKVIDANPAFYRSMLANPGEVLGRDLKTLKTGLADEKLSSRIWAALARDGHWRGEISSGTKNGETHADWLTMSAIKDEQGEITNHVGVFTRIPH